MPDVSGITGDRPQRVQLPLRVASQAAGPSRVLPASGEPEGAHTLGGLLVHISRKKTARKRIKLENKVVEQYNLDCAQRGRDLHARRPVAGG